MSELQNVRDEIRELATQGKWDEIAGALTDRHPGDLADIVEVLPAEYHDRVFALIQDDVKPDVLAELEGRAGTDVLKALTNDELADIVEEMAPDDAADVLADLPEERSEQVLDLMEDEESEDVRELLKYGEETAGGRMTTEFVSFRDTLTVAEAIEHIAFIDEDEPFYNAYVVGERATLKGYIGLWELLKVRDRSKTLGSVCHREITSVPTDMDQEEVARIMSKYDLTAIPVVGPRGSLVGRITWDDIMDVMEEEASEDLFRFAGSDDAELEYTSPLMACKVRLPWLLITLVTGFLTSFILRRFVHDLAHVLALSFFVPIVLAMGGNTGIQSSTLIVRGLALGTLEGKGILRLLGREMIAGALMGVFCGLIIGLWAKFLIAFGQGAEAQSSIYLGFVVGLALLAAMTFAAVFGAFVPIVLDRMHVDPAVASGPFVTASNDILALLIYYGVAISLVSICYQPSG